MLKHLFNFSDYNLMDFYLFWGFLYNSYEELTKKIELLIFLSYN